MLEYEAKRKENGEEKKVWKRFIEEGFFFLFRCFIFISIFYILTLAFADTLVQKLPMYCSLIQSVKDVQSVGIIVK